MKNIPKQLRPVIKLFTSLKLTVFLLVCALVLTFFGTLAQVEIGLYEVQKQYFQNIGIILHQQPIPNPEGGNYAVIPIPMPGGYLIGIFLLTNLIIAFIARFKLTKAKVGIYISHIGLILLLLGQLITEMYQEESNIRFEEGENRNYSESYRKFELAFEVPGEEANKQKVIAIPEPLLAKAADNKKALTYDSLPFNIQVIRHFTNSTIQELAENAQRSDFLAAGQRFAPIERPNVYTMDEINIPAYEVELVSKDSNSLVGKYLLTPELFPQKVISADQELQVQLRFKRSYKPFSLYLVDFRHDKFTGTETPRNFSSLVQLVNPNTGENRPVNIKMNSPLRYNGETYYQASFDKVNPRLTVLQVVKNPSWLIPYIACGLMTLGLTIQFLFHLSKFVGKQMKANKKQASA